MANYARLDRDWRAGEPVPDLASSSGRFRASVGSSHGFGGSGTVDPLDPLFEPYPWEDAEMNGQHSSQNGLGYSLSQSNGIYNFGNGNASGRHNSFAASAGASTLLQRQRGSVHAERDGLMRSTGSLTASTRANRGLGSTPTAYSRFPKQDVNSWLDNLRSKIHSGLAGPEPAPRSPSPLRAQSPSPPPPPVATAVEEQGERRDHAPSDSHQQLDGRDGTDEAELEEMEEMEVDGGRERYEDEEDLFGSQPGTDNEEMEVDEVQDGHETQYSHNIIANALDQVREYVQQDAHYNNYGQVNGPEAPSRSPYPIAPSHAVPVSTTPQGSPPALLPTDEADKDEDEDDDDDDVVEVVDSDSDEEEGRSEGDDQRTRQSGSDEDDEGEYEDEGDEGEYDDEDDRDQQVLHERGTDARSDRQAPRFGSNVGVQDTNYGRSAPLRPPVYQSYTFEPGRHHDEEDVGRTSGHQRYPSDEQDDYEDEEREEDYENEDEDEEQRESMQPDPRRGSYSQTPAEGHGSADQPIEVLSDDSDEEEERDEDDEGEEEDSTDDDAEGSSEEERGELWDYDKQVPANGEFDFSAYAHPAQQDTRRHAERVGEESDEEEEEEDEEDEEDELEDDDAKRSRSQSDEPREPLEPDHGHEDEGPRSPTPPPIVQWQWSEAQVVVETGHDFQQAQIQQVQVDATSSVPGIPQSMIESVLRQLPPLPAHSNLGDIPIDPALLEEQAPAFLFAPGEPLAPAQPFFDPFNYAVPDMQADLAEQVLGHHEPAGILHEGVHDQPGNDSPHLGVFQAQRDEIPLASTTVPELVESDVVDMRMSPGGEDIRLDAGPAKPEETLPSVDEGHVRDHDMARDGVEGAVPESEHEDIEISVEEREPEDRATVEKRNHDDHLEKHDHDDHHDIDITVPESDHDIDATAAEHDQDLDVIEVTSQASGHDIHDIQEPSYVESAQTSPLFRRVSLHRPESTAMARDATHISVDLREERPPLVAEAGHHVSGFGQADEHVAAVEPIAEETVSAAEPILEEAASTSEPAPVPAVEPVTEDHVTAVEDIAEKPVSAAEPEPVAAVEPDADDHEMDIQEHESRTAEIAQADIDVSNAPVAMENEDAVKPGNEAPAPDQENAEGQTQAKDPLAAPPQEKPPTPRTYHKVTVEDEPDIDRPRPPQASTESHAAEPEPPIELDTVIEIDEVQDDGMPTETEDAIPPEMEEPYVEEVDEPFVEEVEELAEDVVDGVQDVDVEELPDEQPVEVEELPDLGLSEVAEDEPQLSQVSNDNHPQSPGVTNQDLLSPPRETREETPIIIDDPEHESSEGDAPSASDSQHDESPDLMVFDGSDEAAQTSTERGTESKLETRIKDDSHPVRDSEAEEVIVLDDDSDEDTGDDTGDESDDESDDDSEEEPEPLEEETEADELIEESLPLEQPQSTKLETEEHRVQSIRSRSEEIELVEERAPSSPSSSKSDAVEFIVEFEGRRSRSPVSSETEKAHEHSDAESRDDDGASESNYDDDDDKENQPPVRYASSEGSEEQEVVESGSPEAIELVEEAGSESDESDNDREVSPSPIVVPHISSGDTEMAPESTAIAPENMEIAPERDTVEKPALEIQPPSSPEAEPGLLSPAVPEEALQRDSSEGRSEADETDEAEDAETSSDVEPAEVEPVESGGVAAKRSSVSQEDESAQSTPRKSDNASESTQSTPQKSDRDRATNDASSDIEDANASPILKILPAAPALPVERGPLRHHHGPRKLSPLPWDMPPVTRDVERVPSVTQTKVQDSAALPEPARVAEPATEGDQAQSEDSDVIPAAPAPRATAPQHLDQPTVSPQERPESATSQPAKPQKRAQPRPLGPPPTTRSNCRFHKLSLTAGENGELKATVLIPQCMLSDRQKIRDENAEYLGVPTDNEEALATPISNQTEHQLHPELATQLMRIAGLSVLNEEGSCYLVESSDGAVEINQAVRKRRYSTRSRSSLARTPDPGVGSSKAGSHQLTPGSRHRKRQSLASVDIPIDTPSGKRRRGSSSLRRTSLSPREEQPVAGSSKGTASRRRSTRNLRPPELDALQMEGMDTEMAVDSEENTLPSPAKSAKSAKSAKRKIDTEESSPQEKDRKGKRRATEAAVASRSRTATPEQEPEPEPERRERRERWGFRMWPFGGRR